MKTYKILNIFTSVLFLYLFFVLLFDSASFFADVDIVPGEAAFFLARRTSMFMIGISILLFLSKNFQHSDTRQAIIIATAVIMLGLATMGTYELVRGNVGKAILMPIAIETIVGISYLAVYFFNRNSIVDEN